jgi:hypothetical protein
MALRIEQRYNRAEAGSTQINNVNVNTGTEDPVPVNKTKFQLIIMYSIHNR